MDWISLEEYSFLLVQSNLTGKFFSEKELSSIIRKSEQGREIMVECGLVERLGIDELHSKKSQICSLLNEYRTVRRKLYAMAEQHNKNHTRLR